MITIKNLDFSYKNVAVFKNISLNFKEGNVYGLLGENGVGKTTSIAKTISRKVDAIKPDLKTKAFFSIMSVMQKKGFNPADVEYWKAKGWTNGKRPWR